MDPNKADKIFLTKGQLFHSCLRLRYVLLTM